MSQPGKGVGGIPVPLRGPGEPAGGPKALIFLIIKISAN
jgi:hypothetical protein